MLYILCEKTHLRVVFSTHEEMHFVSLETFIKNLCQRYLTSYEGMNKAVKKNLNINVRIPLYLNQDLFLFPTAGIRNDNCCFINYQLLYGAYTDKDGIYLYFYGNQYLKVNLSQKVLNRLFKNCLEILKYQDQLRALS